MPRKVMHLAELGIRVTDLPRSVAFYRDVVGLEIVREFPGYAFLKTGDLDSPLGRGAHPQLLALFDREVPLDTRALVLLSRPGRQHDWFIAHDPDVRE